jgi:hypothetical protein
VVSIWVFYEPIGAAIKETYFRTSGGIIFTKTNLFVPVTLYFNMSSQRFAHAGKKELSQNPSPESSSDSDSEDSAAEFGGVSIKTEEPEYDNKISESDSDSSTTPSEKSIITISDDSDSEAPASAILEADKRNRGNIAILKRDLKRTWEEEERNYSRKKPKLAGPTISRGHKRRRGSESEGETSGRSKQQRQNSISDTIRKENRRQDKSVKGHTSPQPKMTPSFTPAPPVNVFNFAPRKDEGIERPINSAQPSTLPYIPGLSTRIYEPNLKVWDRTTEEIKHGIPKAFFLDEPPQPKSDYILQDLARIQGILENWVAVINESPAKLSGFLWNEFRSDTQFEKARLRAIQTAIYDISIWV